MRSTAQRLDAPKTMTVDQWSSLPEDEPGELVGGVLLEEEVPDLTHETAVSWFVGTLRGWIVPRGGFVFGSEAKFGLAPGLGRKPDVTVYLPGGKRLPARGPVRVPPDVAIEVVSPTPRDGRRDRIEKPDEYARFGVRFYWIVDPAQRSLEVLELVRGRRYLRVLSATEGRLARVPGCPGLELDLGAAWTEIDRLEQPRGGRRPRGRR